MVLVSPMVPHTCRSFRKGSLQENHEIIEWVLVLETKFPNILNLEQRNNI